MERCSRIFAPAKAMPKAAAKTSQAKTVGGGHPRSPNGARSETEKDIRKNPKNIWSPDWDELAKEKFAELGGKKHGNRFNPQSHTLVAKVHRGDNLYLGALPLAEKLPSLEKLELKMQIHCFKGCPTAFFLFFGNRKHVF